MDRNNYFRRNLIIVLTIIVLLAISVDLTRSQFLYQKTNHTLLNDGLGYRSSKTESKAADFDRAAVERYLVVYNPDEDASDTLKNNIVQTVRYLKREVDEVKASDLKHVSLENYDTVIIAERDLSDIGILDKLMLYGEQGGHLFFATRPEVNDAMYQIYRKLGIVELGAYVTTTGVKLNTNILLQGKDKSFSGNFISNSSTHVQLDKTSTIHAISSEHVPLLWETGIGKGKVAVFNGTMLVDKASRGLIAGAIATSHEDYMYPIMNTKVAFIDDFPTPFYNVESQEIHKAYNRTVPAFYRDIWWPDMLQTAKKYDLKYTGVLIKTYNDKVEPPFDDPKGTQQSSLIIYGRELLKNAGEIGLHGYNHQSFANSVKVTETLDYKPWTSISNMVAALQLVKSYMEQIFPSYEMHTYVPPSNVLSDEGREAIKQVFPNMKIISSVYHEDFVAGIAYVQEFGVAKDGMIEMPRLSSGYGMSESDQWAMINAVSSIGAFSHFVHPDDVLDSKRNGGRTWEEMYREYNDMMSKIKAMYPWLRSMTATESGIETMHYTQEKIRIDHTQDGIKGYVDGFTGDLYYLLRTDKKIKILKDCSVEEVDKGVYVVRVKQNKFEIGLD
ncbi:DUF2194 domain-containing protein [Paenibacillus rigui]|uniref:DUF2194 domain-containing protein n=1 Tax=Paenibacillus rigui TaxID=554312 RepID=A0A229UTR4_9BACL|nr:DUF2194 domain-containing protein [Paenibacillus rigui]OXM86661.1 hypothetical protein CF651_09445 [Paenibacillus rigui]